MDWGVLAEFAFDQVGGAQNTVTQVVDNTAVPGEAPVVVTSARGRDEWSNGTLVLTTHRLVYVKEGKPTVAVPLAGVTDVAFGTSRLAGNVVKVTAISGAHSWENVADGPAFVARLREAVTGAALREQQAPQPAAPSAEPVAGGAGGSAILDGLERLATLHRAGALTDEEFTAAKRRLIEG
ncbi:SHOCT domain-containing protein [Embleya sp. NPDC059259]|uniref:SHOCT domain-containing protein n=1 Tax=unclassified Embleya TaxID=2699296 RepID=UPI0036C822F9